MSETSETIERVLYNPVNDKFAIGIRVTFKDKLWCKEMDQLEKYDISFTSGSCHGYVVDNEDGIWVMVSQEIIERSKIEDWGFL